MSEEELVLKVEEYCPKMLDNEHFMDIAKTVFCKNERIAVGRELSDDEYDAWKKLSEKLYTATIAQLIKHLEDNFSPDDKVCYMDYVQGYKNKCEYMTKDQLGSRFFQYVKDLKAKNMKRFKITDEKADIYPYVDDNDVIII